MRSQWHTWNNMLKRGTQVIWSKKTTFLLVAIALMLGRAVILDHLMPFAIAYFAVIYFMRKDLVLWIGLALVGGSMLAINPAPIWIAMELLVLFLIFRGLEAYERADLSTAPMLVFTSTLVVQLFQTLIGDALSWYAFMMISVESILAFVLTLVFVQALPVLMMSKKTAVLKNEEIICVMILLASIMTGAVGITLSGLSLEHILSRFVLLLFAVAGGAPLGAAVGVVTGLILSLADVGSIVQISMLAFAGLLAGLLREGGKVATAFGMLLGTSIITVYIGSQAQIMSSTWESVVAAGLLLMTPKSMIRAISRYVPGTLEHVQSQHEYVRKVRDVTANRVAKFSDVFSQLSKSFGQFSEGVDFRANREEELGKFMHAVSEQSCASCHRQHSCWDKKYFHTHQMMSEMLATIEEDQPITPSNISSKWRSHCLKPEQVAITIKHQYELYGYQIHWKKQLQDSRQLVADQLYGVSQIMDDLSLEIKREGQTLHLQEEQIREAVEGLGLSIQGVNIVNLEEGNVDIEVYHTFDKGFDECRKIIAPLLSDILGENIAVKMEVSPLKNGDPYMVNFGSAKQYEVETGVAGAAKGGDLLSGDSFSLVDLGNGKFAVAISDGMGNGERARQESSTALSILQQLLQSGMDEKLAVKSVNSVLVLRSVDEVFATVDLAIIDLYSAQTTFMKIGSTPSFIKRGNEVIEVAAGNLPIGILQDIDVDIVSAQLQPGDTLIMMSDGIYDAPGYAVNKEMWMRRVISELKVEDPQEMADVILETVVRYQDGDINDDMTVLVTKIDKHQPEWSTFRFPGVHRLERPRTVS
ncbi:stage II sporulation protein E [Paenibacillus yanchengensis]|uniref:Stage II sporulation protein E n=1 Tax=Paenibacillus yanchengensis TaxID=2035833 RepID=A0ABW4YIF3_9BACL